MSAPLNSGTAMNISAPIIAMISAPPNALAKLFTVKPETSDAANIIIKALMIRANNPKLKTDKGAVKNHSTGRRKALISPSAAAAMMKPERFFTWIPGTIKIANPSPMAVASQAMVSVISNVNVLRPFYT